MYFGDFEETLGDINDAAKFLDAVHSLFDRASVVFPCGVQDPLHLAHLAVGPLLVHGTSVFADRPEDAENTEQDN